MVIVTFTTDTAWLEFWIYLLDRLNQRYRYATLRPLDERRLALELPEKNAATWRKDDEEFFHTLVDEGFLQEWSKCFYHFVEVDDACEQGETRSMTIVFFSLAMPYEFFSAFTQRVKALYPYSALQSLGSHDYALELPDVSSKNWPEPPVVLPPIHILPPSRNTAAFVCQFGPWPVGNAGLVAFLPQHATGAQLRLIVPSCVSKEEECVPQNLSFLICILSVQPTFRLMHCYLP